MRSLPSETGRKSRIKLSILVLVTMVASLLVGFDGVALAATAPGAPTIGVAVGGNAQATVTWTAPASDGGSPITGYVVTPYVGFFALASTTFNSVATSQTVVGLANGTSYRFRVRAINGIGTGAFSLASNPVVPAPTVPGAPTIGSATAGIGQAVVTWTAPGSDGGSPITGYSVTPYVGAVAQTPVVFNSVATSQAVTGLTNGTTYTFTVAAINAVGTGGQSAASNSVTPLTVPGAPTIGTVMAGNGQVSVSWTPPVSDGGSPITGHQVTPYIGLVAQAPTIYNSNASTQTVLGLTNGTTYTFRVAAINVVGTGAQSGPSSAVTPLITAAGDGGGAHSCVLLPGTDVECWGLNSSGQLGDGTMTNRTSPVSVGGILGADALVTGDSHTCVLLAGGTVTCWGSNTFGQLGDGTLISRVTPMPVSGLSGVTAISSSRYHTCALLAAGTVKCWGYNVHGEVGDGTTTGRRLPTSVPGLSGVAAITTGSWHTCARLTTGAARCWGSNTRGQLGDGTLTQRLAPVSVSGLSNASALVALGSSTCAITAGTVKCWGFNHHGQLGDNTIANRTTPVSVVGLSGVTDLAGGLYHACALLSGGTVKCWGYASYGQLGNASPTERHTPVAVIGLTGVASLAAGAHHTLARLTSGAVRGWGASSAGQLGDNTNVNRTTPVPTIGLG